MVELHPQPPIRRAADRLLEPQRHFGRNAGLAANDAVELLPRHAEPCGGLSDAHAQCLNILFQSYAWMRRILHRHLRTLMIVEQVDIERAALFEPKDNAPIGAHRNRPIALPISLERMQSKARPVHRSIALAASSAARMMRIRSTRSGDGCRRSSLSNSRFRPL